MGWDGITAGSQETDGVQVRAVPIWPGDTSWVHHKLVLRMSQKMIRTYCICIKKNQESEKKNVANSYTVVLSLVS